MKVFPGLSEERNQNLLDVLTLLAIKTNNVHKLSKDLGQSYSGVYVNVRYLEDRDFVKVLRVDKKRSKVFDLTVRGALASIFSTHNLKPNNKTLQDWEKRDWGARYDGLNPFQKVLDLDELRKSIEVMYIQGNTTLEEVNDDILKRIVVDPISARNYFKDAQTNWRKTVEETGDYVITHEKLPPGSSLVCKVEGKKYAYLIINPDEATGRKLLEVSEKDAFFERKLGFIIQKVIQSLVNDKPEDKGSYFMHYSPETQSHVMTGLFPDKLVASLTQPEEIIKYPLGYLDSIIKQFTMNESFIKGEKAIFYFRSLKYDPLTKRIYSPPEKEIAQKAKKFIENLSQQYEM